MERITISISGMSCGGCVNSVRNALARLPGVEVEQVEVGTTVVSYDSDVTTPEAIHSAIVKAGFEPWGLKDPGTGKVT
jgi:copper chaperone